MDRCNGVVATRLLALLVALTLSTAATAGGLLFADGFETDDPPVQTQCDQGPVPATALAGSLGALPGDSILIGCVEIRNDLSAQRADIAWGGIPIARSRNLVDGDLARLALRDASGQRVAAQFEILSRWGAPLADAAAPIRWLQVVTSASLEPESAALYELRLFDEVLPDVATLDPFAVAVSENGSQVTIATGLGQFVLDATAPALITGISADPDNDGAGEKTVILNDTPQNGPVLNYDGIDGARFAALDLDQGNARVTRFEIVERGPVKAVVLLEAEFSAGTANSLCPEIDPNYERFDYTLVATFARASRDVMLQFQFRNRCSDGFGVSWTDNIVNLTGVHWRLPLALTGTTQHAIGDSLVSSAAEFSGTTEVIQRTGAGDPWARRAELRVDGAAQQQSEGFAAPLVALQGEGFVVSLAMPWMRYREPQALRIEDRTLVFSPVAEPLILGEGKGLWNYALLKIEPEAGGLAAQLAAAQADSQARLERGLLVRRERAGFSAAGITASLGNDQPSAVRDKYLGFLTSLHDANVGDDPQDQWVRFKTYGSQLWPEVQFDDSFGTNSAQNPADNDARYNYWNASGAEMLEFLRAGDPKWVWDFSMPISWLEMYTAYLNIGSLNHGRSGGTAVTSGGFGEGQWHRSNFGSDDYTYNAGQQYAYALRPSPALRDRFAFGGANMLNRYQVPQSQQASRDFFLERVTPERQNIQHFELIANCAEFVPGAQGQACHDRLMQILDEFGQENFPVSGVICQADVVDFSDCRLPQQFMTNALIYPFFYRMFRNYGDRQNTLRNMLEKFPLDYYNRGIPRLGDGVTIDVNGDWIAAFDCVLDGAGQVQNCSPVASADGFNLLLPNYPHTMALGLMADDLNPAVDLCQISRQALDAMFAAPGFGPWDIYDGGGWWKGSAQVMQSMVFAVGLYDTCAD